MTMLEVFLILALLGTAINLAMVRLEAHEWRMESREMQRRWLDAEDRAIRAEIGLLNNPTPRHEFAVYDPQPDEYTNWSLN